MNQPSKDVDLSQFTRPQLEVLAQTPGPLRPRARRELQDRPEGVDIVLNNQELLRHALELLTPKQKKQLEETTGVTLPRQKEQDG